MSPATVPLLSNVDAGGGRGARATLVWLDAFRCCCRDDEAAPRAEASAYLPPAPPDAPQQIRR